jgi:tetratricopeptide (TPR) repeat protein
MEYYDRAIAEFNTASKAWPDTSLTYRYLGYTYNNKGDFDGALGAYEKAWAVGKDSEALLRAGRIYLERGNRLKTAFRNENAEGLKIQQKLADVKKNTKKTDVTQILGAPDNVKKGPRGTKKEEWSYRSFNLVLTIDNDKVVSKSFTSPYQPPVDSSKFRLAMAEYDKSISALETVRRNNPGDTEALNVLLSAYVEADRIKEAAAVFSTAVERDPTNKLNHYILGVLLRTAGDYPGAISHFKTAYELDGSYTDAIFDLGATYYNWGVDILKASEDRAEPTEEHKEKFREALPYMEKVSEMKGDDPAVWETLGTIYAQLGMQQKAIAAFDKADALRTGVPVQRP